MGGPSGRVTVCHYHRVQTPSYCGVSGAIEDAAKVVACEVESPIVTSLCQAERVGYAGEVLRGRPTPHRRGGTRVATAVGVKECLDRAVATGDDHPAGVRDGGRHQTSDCRRLVGCGHIHLTVGRRAQVKSFVLMSAPTGERIGSGQDGLQTRQSTRDCTIWAQRHFCRYGPSDVLFEGDAAYSGVVPRSDLHPQRQRLVRRGGPRERLRRGRVRGTPCGHSCEEKDGQQANEAGRGPPCARVGTSHDNPLIGRMTVGAHGCPQTQC